MSEKFSNQIKAQQKLAEEKASVFRASQAALWELTSKFNLPQPEAQLVNILAHETILGSSEPLSENAITSLVHAVRIQLEVRRQDKPGMMDEYEKALHENLQP